VIPEPFLSAHRTAQPSDHSPILSLFYSYYNICLDQACTERWNTAFPSSTSSALKKSLLGHGPRVPIKIHLGGPAYRLFPDLFSVPPSIRFNVSFCVSSYRDWGYKSDCMGLNLRLKVSLRPRAGHQTRVRSLDAFAAVYLVSGCTTGRHPSG